MEIIIQFKLKTFEKIKQSSIIVYVFDCTQLSEEEVLKDIEQLHAGEIPVVLLGNKIDLNNKRQINAYPNLNVHFIAAKSHTNIGGLKKILHDIILQNKSTGATDTIVSNLRHYEALNKARTALETVRSGIENKISGELVSLDLREALNALGTITGAIDIDLDVLGAIFSKFCIGK